MGKILIIGNGFDLYHRLPTRYTDFLFFMNKWEEFKKQYDAVAVNSDKTGKISVRLDDAGRLTDDSLADFAAYKGYYDENNLKLLNENAENLWMEYFKVRMPKENNWIDFEDEVYRALQQVENFYIKLPQIAASGRLVSMEMPSTTVEVLQIFCKKVNSESRISLGLVKKEEVEPERLAKNKAALLSAMRQELDKLLICLRLYLLEFVSRIGCEVLSPQIRNLAGVCLLNFNYTHTFETVYGGENAMKIHCVHGDINKGNLVLGIPDDTFQGSLDYIYFQKFFQRIQKKTGNDYRKWTVEPYAPTLNDTRAEVYIMGHSLSAVDKGVLDVFFKKEHVKQVTVFYHSQSSYEDIVINLVDMFGKDFVIEKVAEEFIVFEELKPAVAL